MITDDQVAELFAEANPIPVLEALEADPVLYDGSQESTPEGGSRMVTVDTGRPEETTKIGSRVALALGVVLAVVVAWPLILTTGRYPNVATPASPEEEALQVADDLFAALTRGDVDGAMSMMAPEMKALEFNRPAVEFLAAQPGAKTLSDCTTGEGPTAVFVSCQTNFSGPLMMATGEMSTALFKVQDGFLTDFRPGFGGAAAEAFALYASHTRPEAYELACSPESYGVASVRIQRTQHSRFALTGPCGELWAQVAEDAAAWVEEGDDVQMGD